VSPGPELEARVEIDAALEAAGWVIQDRDSASLPEPHILAQEIAGDLRSAPAQIEDILGDLDERVGGPQVSVS
jgi:hypothetical protein